MPLDWTAHYSALFRDYLAAAPPESGIPDLSALPKKKQTDTAKQKRPRIIVTCEAGESNHRSIFAGTVKITLGINITPDGDQPAEASEILAAIEDWLLNDEAWKVFILTLSIEARTGWAITHKSLGRLQTETDEEKHTQDLTLPINLRALAKR